MLLDPILWILPAYVSNASATLSRYLNPHPVSVSLLGEGKTWEGIVIGVVMGSIAGFLLGRPIEGFLMSVGSMGGDMLGSYVKRRYGLPRGEDAPFLDQLDFLVGATLLVPPPPEYWGVIILATLVLHRVTNILGYMIGAKREPW